MLTTIGPVSSRRRPSGLGSMCRAEPAPRRSTDGAFGSAPSATSDDLGAVDTLTPRADGPGTAYSATSISCLLELGGPSAVVGHVVPVVVDAVDGHAIGSRTHVGKERLERCPSRVVRDTTTSVAGIEPIMRVVAPVSHGSPRAPSAMQRPALRCAVLATGKSQAPRVLSVSLGADKVEQPIWHRPPPARQYSR